MGHAPTCPLPFRPPGAFASVCQGRRCADILFSSLDVFGKLSSTPPLPPIALRGVGNAYISTSPTTSSRASSQQYAGGYPDPGACGLKEDVWLSGPGSSPPSPSTIGSTSDSQTGGDYFPPSSESTGEADDSFGRARSASQPSSFRRHNLSLNISALPLQNIQLTSPSSLASSSAPFTDSFSYNSTGYSTDYFQFDDASLPSAGAGDSGTDTFPLGNQQFGYRLPASQPSSPVRSIYPPGGAPFNFQPGRQRGATFSGGSFSPDEQFAGGPLFQLSQPPSAIPSHFSLSSVQGQSPLNSPLNGSPVINQSPADLAEHSYFAKAVQAHLNAGLGVDVSMEDVSTPTPGQPNPLLSPAAPIIPRRASQTAVTEMSGEMAEKLVLMDQMMATVQNAKAALLRGREGEASINLGQISNQLEVASELGVAPTPTPREGSTPSSQGISPIAPFQASPIAPTMIGSTIQPSILQTPSSSQTTSITQPMPVAPSGLLPSLPVDGLRRPSPSAISTAGNLATPYARPEVATADFANPPSGLQPPPLVHSHSFPNGHQLPSQLHGATPTTPVLPSPSFTASLGIAHAPLVSSPLATMPVSRPPSPPRPYPIPEQPWLETAAMEPARAPDTSMVRRPSDGRPDGRPIINRSRSASVNKWTVGTMTPNVPPSAWHSRHASPDEDEDSDKESEDESSRRTKRRRSSATKDDAPDMMNSTAAPMISDDIRRQLDQIFEEFLSRVCSDLEAVDSKGEKLHQVLMPKKMARLDESTDYRPFKFRIQAFTNAFHEDLQARGITEETMSIKKVKTYLWHQDLISRFNADGKKAKSKGNHIWNVDAKKLPSGGWVFRPFQRRINGTPTSFAIVHQKYEWEPKIWDPQAASETLRPSFRSPPGTLPPWLNWEDGQKLVGIPTEPSAPVQITTIADFYDAGNNKCSLDMTFTVQAVLQHHYPNDPMAAVYQAQLQAQAQQAQQAAYGVPWPGPEYGDPQAMGGLLPMSQLAQQGMPYGSLPPGMYVQPGLGSMPGYQ